MKKTLAILLLGVFTVFTTNAQYKNTTIKVGQEVPQLDYPSPDGTNISLKQVNKGRYVLLDFWASWCGPCRMTSPSLVKLYDTYKDKKFKDAPNGFTIVSVSLDGNKGRWIDAIKKDNLYWKNHMSDLKAWQSEAAKIYGVQFIPQSFLIGPDGKIIAKYQSIGSATEAAKDLAKYVKR